MSHVRRVVVGLSPSGRSTVLFDGPPPNTIEPLPGLVFSDIWENTSIDATWPKTDDSADRPIHLEPAPNQSIFKIVTYPPAGSFCDSDWAKVYETIGASSHSNDGGAFHHTSTVDYVVVAAGEICCLLEEGEVLLKAGDVLVQQGTNHAWINRSDRPATIIGIMIDQATGAGRSNG
jgi:mannose-6-phosphate isomerase-like protein (cupin superfamily)